MKKKMDTQYDRRDFLKLGAGIGAALAVSSIGLSGCGKQLKGTSAAIGAGEAAAPIDTVRIGFVGVGGRGRHLLRLLLRLEGIQVKAICDIVESKVAAAMHMVREAGQPNPAGYARGETDFKRMCENENLDLVITATPWEWHVPVCVSAMKTGKHAATEVPAAVTIDECWQLVETSEKSGRHCVMLENCCYGRTEMMALNMVRKGLLGELLHGECGYLHDLRAMKFDNTYEGKWRLTHSVKRNGNLYTTHGLGPVAQCMNIDRGDRFDYLVSMSGKSRGLNLYAAKEFGPGHELATQKYALGDINVSLIHTVNGLTITLYHDCSSPRPYSRINLVQGTKGIVRGYPEPALVYIENKSPNPHKWERLENYAAEFEHPLWKAERDRAKGSGHGGMDHMVLYRLIECLRSGTPPDMDVYDAASWSAVSELTERSAAKKSRAVDFPDFTRGRWKTRSPLGIVGA